MQYGCALDPPVVVTIYIGQPISLLDTFVDDLYPTQYLSDPFPVELDGKEENQICKVKDS